MFNVDTWAWVLIEVFFTYQYLALVSIIISMLCEYRCHWAESFYCPCLFTLINMIMISGWSLCIVISTYHVRWYGVSCYCCCIVILGIWELGPMNLVSAQTYGSFEHIFTVLEQWFSEGHDDDKDRLKAADSSLLWPHVWRIRCFHSLSTSENDLR
jgi:hypothetical protein